jgi:hypothetical protein
VTIDYEVPRLSRVVTSQYVTVRLCYLHSCVLILSLLLLFITLIHHVHRCYLLLVFSAHRGLASSYVILTLEGQYFGATPGIRLYTSATDTSPLITTAVTTPYDYTLGYGANYNETTMGKLILCGVVDLERTLECAYFYGNNVSARPPACLPAYRVSLYCML